MIKRIVVEGNKKEYLEGAVEALETAHVAFEEASFMVKLNIEKLWEQIRQTYPEVLGKELGKLKHPKGSEWSITYFSKEEREQL